MITAEEDAEAHREYWRLSKELKAVYETQGEDSVAAEEIACRMDTLWWRMRDPKGEHREAKP